MYTSKTQFEDQQRSEFLSFLDDVLQEENPFEDKGGYLVAEVAGVSLSIEIEVDNWDELPDVSAVLRKIAVGTGKWTLVKSVWVDEDGAEEVASLCRGYAKEKLLSMLQDVSASDMITLLKEAEELGKEAAEAKVIELKEAA